MNFILLILSCFTAVYSEETCWWTGCQNKNWAVRGCKNYNREQKNIRDCNDGNEFFCCPKSKGDLSRPTRQDNTNKFIDCWWSGCQKNNWAVRGCSSYNKTQQNIRDCEDGNEYYCCTRIAANDDLNDPPKNNNNNELSDCWWSGCQKKDWAVRGCESYDRIEKNIRDCDNGNEFFCCAKPAGEISSIAPPKDNIDDKFKDCWWTGCQKNNWGVRGCDSYNKTQKDIKDCDDGNEFYCCTEIINNNDNAIKDCWWSGCQKNNWAVRGCGSYNRTQKDIRDCDDGNEYYCCSESPKDNNNNNNSNNNNNNNNNADSDNEKKFECLWSPCQLGNWTTRGCPPDATEAAIQSCAEYGAGDMFQCCFDKTAKIDKTDEEVNLLTGASFTNYAKHLLLKSRNFTLVPDNLPCLSLDTEKESILKIKDEGIYTCDLCPYFPHKRLVNVFLNTNPLEIRSNTIFPECFGSCFDRSDCVAFSYDDIEHSCYMYNNTKGTYTTESKWITILMAQPVGIINDWSYSRHTEITGEPFESSKENLFQKCLEKCDNNKNCNYVSYSLQETDCLMFNTLEKINYIDLSYAVITAFRITSVPVGNDPSSRFIEEGADLSIAKRSDNVLTNEKCSSSKNSTHSSYFSKDCYASGALGCDAITGCKLCYYPEKVDTLYNLIPCPDSVYVLLDEVKKSIQVSMTNCLKEKGCIGVGYISSTQEIRLLNLENFALVEYSTKYLLRYPIDNSEDYEIMSDFDFLFGYDIVKISNEPNTYNDFRGKTLKDCLNLFKSNNNYIAMSFSNMECKLSSKAVGYTSKNNRCVTVTKKPKFTSSLINYVKTPGFAIPHNKAKETYDQCKDNCESICANKCNKEFQDWCTHFSVEYNSNTNICFFYEFLNEVNAVDVNLQQKENEQIFTKQTNLDFTLDSLNKLNPFQTSDIYNCFQANLNSEQTQTSLSLTNSKSLDETSSVSLRRKRGFFSFLKKAFKKVGNFIADTVKSVVKPIVDTAKGVVNTVKNVVKGDFKAAKDSFMNIPVVKDVKNVVELGKAVVTGDWESAKNRGADLLQSSTLDIATSFIPVGGKVIGTGLKTIGKQIGKQSARAKRAAKGKIDKVKGNDKKIKKDEPNNKKDKEIDNNRKQCKNKSRHKRETRGKKRRHPGDCDEDEDDKATCPKPIINNVIEESMSKCTRRVRNAICEYECLPGYDEPSRNVKCLKEGNRDAFWSPRPDCDLVHCSTLPIIPIHTPQITSFGSIEFGKHLTAYVVNFNINRKLPFWSIALHQSDQFQSKNYNALQAESREDDFKPYPCPELKNQQGRLVDYRGSGWDRGHLTPANVARWSIKALSSSNLFINIAPQDPHTNQQPWKFLEGHIECFSKTKRSLVATGLCNTDIGKTPKGLSIPSCYWKMICYKDENSKEQVIGFIAKNTHVTTNADKVKRAKEIYTPVDQKDIKPLFSGGSPWMLSATEINKGRPIQVGSFPSVWFPVNPYDCEKALEISKEEKDAWNEALMRLQMDKLKISNRKRKAGNSGGSKPGGSKKKPKPNKKGGRTKRQAQASKLKRGCKNMSELRNMVSLLGIGSVGDGDDDDDNSENEIGDGQALVTVQSCNKRIVGYYTSWLDKTIDAFQLQRLTHVIYAFLEMQADGSIDIGSADRKNAINADEETNKSKERLENLMQMASAYPHLKVSFAVGGWENSQYFSSVASDPGKRVNFIGSIIKMIQRFGFDGVDIDWEYPVTGGANEGMSQDKENYVLLMKEIRNALDTLASDSGRSEKFLLSFAGAAGQWTLDPGFDLPGLFKYVDFANIMSYDFFGAWESKWGAYTGPPAPLHFGMPTGFSGKTNVDWSVKYYTCKTSLPHKINMGVPFYGRYWKNVGDPVDGKDGMWRKAQQVNGKFEGGYVPYDKISEFLGSGGFEENFHEKSKTPYAWNPGTKTFLGYENEKSLEFKVKYAAEKNIGGLMIWALEQDDDSLSLLDLVSNAPLCDKTNPNEINFKCSPIDEKRWWTPEDGDDKAGLCGKSAPLYKGYYPVCDPDDPGYSCCGYAGYCGTGPKYCDCPTCKNYMEDPKKILEEPIKPSVPVTWYLLNDPEGKRGRCGRKIPKINGVYPTCNPDDVNTHCCSNGGYCGNTDAHCKCNGCVDFKSNPNYKYGPKKWWDLSDGEDLGGKCGPKAPKVDGIYEAECEPNTKFSCCSPNGFCGSGADYCDCNGCKKFT